MLLNFNEVLQSRRTRFALNSYWSVWRDYTFFFGLCEAVFHRTNRHNVLSLLSREDAQFFTDPVSLLKRFPNIVDLVNFFKIQYQKCLENPCVSRKEAAAVLRFINQNAEFMINNAKIVSQKWGSVENIFYTYNFDIITYTNSIINCEATEVLSSFTNTLLISNIRKEFMQFNGFGRKITNMYLNCACDIAEIAIDVRVFKFCLANNIIKDNEFRIENDNHKAAIELRIYDYLVENNMGHVLLEIDALMFAGDYISQTELLRSV